jgi:two-component system chemotaxis response regulator CheB
MPVRALVVDDSAFFRKRIMEILKSDADIEVVGGASNGREAVDMTARLKPDVITMDIEMPVMDGISAVREIMARNPTPILMFSTLTHDGARATLDALDAGAMDFMPKKFEDIAANREDAIAQFRSRVRALGRRRTNGGAATRPAPQRETAPAQVVPRAAVRPAALRIADYKLLAIGASTGGPVALQKILTQLPQGFPVPVVITQHMPASFTSTFAERLNQICKVKVKEAEDGEELKPATAYIAPGGKQMLIQRGVGRATLSVRESDPNLTYKPCVDVTFASIASGYRNEVLAIVLTGMGADGCEGARRIKAQGAQVWAQDEASCVVYGMPQAVVNAGLADQIMSINDIARTLAQSV